MSDERPDGAETYVEFDTASLRSALRVYGGAFQLNYSGEDAVLTFGHEGDALPSENGELEGKKFAEVVVFLNPRKAEELASAMIQMIDFWVRKHVLDEQAIHRVLSSTQIRIGSEI